jgi:hypothetical protein
MSAMAIFHQLRYHSESSSPLAFHPDAPIYIAVAKARIRAARVICERIGGLT